MSNCPADERDVSLCCPPHIVAYIERLVRERDEAKSAYDWLEAKNEDIEIYRQKKRAERAEAECERLREALAGMPCEDPVNDSPVCYGDRVVKTIDCGNCATCEARKARGEG